MDCFAALAMTSKHTFTFSPRDAPEALMNLPPKEGVGNAGCPLHPRPRVHFVVVERTRVTTSTPESPDFAVRCNIPRQLAVDRSQVFRQLALPSIARKTLPRPPHPSPRP